MYSSTCSTSPTPSAPSQLMPTSGQLSEMVLTSGKKIHSPAGTVHARSSVPPVFPVRKNESWTWNWSQGPPLTGLVSWSMGLSHCHHWAAQLP